MELPSSSDLKVFKMSAKKAGCVRMGGFSVNQKGMDLTRMRLMEDYVFVYVLAHAVQYRDAQGSNRRLQPGDALLLCPGVAHAYTPVVEQCWTSFWVQFHGRVFEDWQAAGFLDPSLPFFHLAPPAYWLPLLKRVIDVNASPMQRMGRLQYFLAEAVATRDQRVISERDHLWLEQAQAALLQVDIPSAKATKRAAQTMATSYDAFRRRFKKLTGETPFRYRQQEMLTRANDLLHDPNLTLAQIADLCGFCDEFHFSKRYHQHYGRTPSQLRKNFCHGV
jgi:AraC-like DNA-binding protein